MNPVIQYALVAAQLALAVRLAMSRRWLLAAYFAVSTASAIYYRPVEDAWWVKHWMEAEAFRMLLRQFVTLRLMMPLKKFAGISGVLFGFGFIAWLWIPMPTDPLDLFSTRRMAWLLILLGWMACSGILAVVDGGALPSLDFGFWSGVLAIYAVGSARTWMIVQEMPPKWFLDVETEFRIPFDAMFRQNREYTSIVLILLVAAWAFYLPRTIGTTLAIRARKNPTTEYITHS